MPRARDRCSILLRLVWAGRFRRADESVRHRCPDVSQVKYRTLRTRRPAVLAASVLVRKHLSALVPHSKHGMNDMKDIERHSQNSKVDSKSRRSFHEELRVGPRKDWKAATITPSEIKNQYSLLISQRILSIS